MHFQACTLNRFYIHKNCTVYMRFELTLPQLPKEDSRSMSTAIEAGALISANFNSFVQNIVKITSFWEYSVSGRYVIYLPMPDVPQKSVDP